MSGAHFHSFWSKWSRMCGLSMKILKSFPGYLICISLRATILESFFLFIHGRILSLALCSRYIGEKDGEQYPYIFFPSTSASHPLLLQILLQFFLLLLIQYAILILVKPSESSRELSDFMLCVPQSEKNRIKKWLLPFWSCDCSNYGLLTFLLDF